MPNTIKTINDPADAVMLLIDHRSGLFQLVKDIDMLRLRHNMSALAKVSRLAKLPTFTTASVPRWSQRAVDSRDPSVQPGGDPHTAHRPDQYVGQPQVGRGDSEDGAQDAAHRGHADQRLLVVAAEFLKLLDHPGIVG